MVRNVVLIILDTVRKDFYDEYATRLHSRSDVSFVQCRAASSTSVPSHASIVTGKLPHKHGIHSYNPYFSDLSRSQTFLDKFPNHRTIGMSANAFAGSAFDFDQLFDEFIDISWTRRFPQGMDIKEFVMTSDTAGWSKYKEFLKTTATHDHPGYTLANALLARFDLFSSRIPLPRLLDDGANTILRTARSWIAEADHPFFMFINLMDAHTPHRNTRGYKRSIHGVKNTWNSMDDLNQWQIKLNGLDGHETDVENFRGLYSASIDYLDRKVSEFIDAVGGLTERETTFVVTSDHGENLGFPEEDMLLGHKSSLSEALLHVPLDLINPPPGFEPTITNYTSHLQLGQLLTGLAANETPSVCSTRVPAERIGTTNTPEFADPAEEEYWSRMLRCVYEGDKKYEWDSLGEFTIFNLNSDKPCWQTRSEDPCDSPPEWAEEFFDEDITSYKSRFATGTDLEASVDEVTRARLEELGYL